MNVAFSMAGGLSQQQLQSVRQLTQRLLWEVGLEIDHTEILALLAKHKGVRVRGKRACFDGELFERCLEEQKSQNADYVWQLPGEPDFTIRSAYYCLSVYDAVTGETRRAELRDVEVAAQLCDSYGIEGPCPVHPQNLPERIREIAMAKACIENSRGVGRWMAVANLDDIRYIVEMSQLAGRKPPYVVLQQTISPMRLNSECLDVVYRIRNSAESTEAITLGGGSIPMLGATAPLSMPAAWAQSAAECIGSYIAAKLVNPHIWAHASFQVYPFDMRTSSFTMGGPEAALSALAGKQIEQYLFGRTHGATLGSMGMPMDAQCNAERMGNALMNALAGSRVFYDAGMAPMDEMYCHEQLVMDVEIVQWIQRVMKGLEFNDDQDAAIEAIRDGITEGDCFGQPWSLEYRSFYWMSKLFMTEKLSTWTAGGKGDIAHRARAIVEQRLRDHQFVLPPDVLAAVDRVYRKAVAASV